MGSQYFIFFIKVTSAVASEVRSAGEGIQNAYRRVQNFVLPHPGPKVAKGSEAHSTCPKGEPCESVESKTHSVFDVVTEYIGDVKDYFGMDSGEGRPLTGMLGA